MPNSPDLTSMALFCDFENIALGVRDAEYDKFDIKRVLERLLLKGSIVVKKAYCDWERYKAFKAPMHEANFELIEIPHVRQSGKNSADIRMVVDALDLCYTKAHVDTFVIISGDSDFSPLVSKLRENAKTVVGVGVKNSTSDLLIANCDEFIYYDDLVREQKKRGVRKTAKVAAKTNGDKKPPRKRATKSSSASAEAITETSVTEASDQVGTPRNEEDRVQEGLELITETVEALAGMRTGDDKVWGSMVKQALKRVKPGFNESYYGFRSFNQMLEEAQSRGLVTLERDEKSGGYTVRLVADQLA
ncbi:MAG TPA: NYN domain-containing protein [Casimicrobiaceae bacterium]|nr:NYN domain-containing protein [Casimicrobiaceae bacterium]